VTGHDSAAALERSGAWTPRHDAYRRALLIALPLVLSAVVWLPLSGAYFFMDDFLNLYQIVNIPFPEYVARPHGGHLLLARNALFHLFFDAFGVHPAPYYWAILITHAINVVLLFRVVSRWTHSDILGAFGATLWGISPVHVGTLGWYSVYGQVIVATIWLWILDRVALAAADGAPLPRTCPIVWPLLLFLASTCFGVGIGLTLVAPVALFLLLPPSSRRTRLCLALLVLAVAYPWIYKGLVRLHEYLSGPTSEGLMASLLISGLQYYDLMAAMLVFLLGYGAVSLVLTFFYTAGAFPGALPYAALAFFAVGFVLAFARATPRTRRQMLGLLVLTLGSYGIIAAGRAIFFRLPMMGAAVAQPRYHYVGTIPLTVLLCLILDHLGAVVRLSTGARYALLALWIAVTMGSFTYTQRFVDLHQADRAETDSVLSAVRAAIAAAPRGGDVYIANKPFNSIGHLLVANQIEFPGWAAVYTIFFPSNDVDGRQVHFVVDDPEVIRAAGTGRRTAGLLVSPPSATPAGSSAPPSSNSPAGG